MKEETSEESRKRGLREFLIEEQGQAATEYILIIGLIVLPIALAFNRFQNPLKTMLDKIARYFQGPGV